MFIKIIRIGDGLISFLFISAEIVLWFRLRDFKIFECLTISNQKDIKKYKKQKEKKGKKDMRQSGAFPKLTEIEKKISGMSPYQNY